MNLQPVRDQFPGRRIDYYESLDSTMRAAAAVEIGAVVVANQQTAGQGRHGHAWHSEAGAGLYVSIVLKNSPLLTLALGLAAREAIAETCGLACDIRWPNDLLLRGRKCGGILAQLVDGRAIGGIGINVNHRQFPEGFSTEATSLRIEGGREFPREALLAALIAAVDRFTLLAPADILEQFTQASSYASGLRVTVDQPGGLVHGVTAGLDDAGFLRVRQDNGTVTLILAGGVRAAGS